MESILTSHALPMPRAKRHTATQSTLTLLFGGDVMVCFISMIIAYYARFELLIELGRGSASYTLSEYMVHVFLGCIAMGAILYINGMYRIETITRYRFGALCMLTSAVYWGILFLFLSLFFRISPEISRLWTFYAATLSGILLGTWRYVFCRHMIGRSLLQQVRRKTVVIGWNEMAQRCYERSESSNRRGDFFPFKILGAIAYFENIEQHDLIPFKIHKGAGISLIEKVLHTGKYDTLIVASTDLPRECVLKLQEICGREMIDFMVIPDFIHTLTSCLRIESFSGLPMLTQNKQEINKTSSELIKRSMDLLGSVLGLIVFGPVIAYFCWRVYRESPGPVFYKQTRLGKHGKLFSIIKIRSMKLDAEQGSGAKWCTENDPRRLKIGAFMRKYNIDELPQFWNVLKGDMSLVGPRPERPELIQDFKHEVSFYNVRHLVKPGITGWAQVNGWRGDTCLESRIACDLEYIERWSPWFDMFICMKTLRANQNAY